MKQPVFKQLQKKYHKVQYITDLKDMLYKSAIRFSKRTAFKLKDSNGKIYKLTYEEFKNDVESLATFLIDSGFKDSSICVIGKNSYKWAVSYMAASIIGIVVPIDKELHYDDVINFMNVSNSKIILGDNKNLEKIVDSKNKLKNQDTTFISFDEKENNNIYLSFDICKKSGNILVQNGNKEFENINVNPDDMHILLFTSGTTGNAKGVCLSHKNICSNIMSVFGIVKVKRNDQVLSILPIHHTYECTLGYLLVIYSGGCIAFCDGLRHISKNISEYHPSIVLSVPLLLENVYNKIIKSLKKSLPEKYVKDDSNMIDNLPWYIKKIVKAKVNNSLGGRLRLFIVGAAAMNPEIIKDFEKLGVRTLQGYGLTECSPLVAGNNDFYMNYASAGLPIPNVEYKIENPDNSGVGEIIVKGPNVMLGYFNDKEETDKVMKDGWFHTGDLGRIDEDGYLYITGRCKTVIVTKNGKNIYPEEVEYYLNDNPLISESLVTGLNYENDDETYVNAQIFPNIEALKEQFAGSVPQKEEIYSIMSNIVSNINKKLPNYKHIKSFIIRDEEFEKTTTKKIKRYGKNLENTKNK